jgi:nitroimidazol reductase NimA-like FMN-containing flavoprotein (pyridoxamine 5'-phosphate oxidase superfamily)
MLGELTQDEILETLQQHTVGRLGCTDGEYVYIVPVGYIFEYDHILCHSLNGMKIDMMRNHPTVCFQLDEIHSLSNWRSIIANGIYEEIVDEKEIQSAKEKFANHHVVKKASISSRPPESMEQPDRNAKPKYTTTVFYRIRFTNLSGRFENEMD